VALINNMEDSYVATFDSKTGQGTMIRRETFWTKAFALPRSTIPSIPVQSPDNTKMEGLTKQGKIQNAQEKNDDEGVWK
jgi:hypothetical protein